MKIAVDYGIEQDVDRVKKTIKKWEWYQEHGYSPRLPEGILPTSSNEEIRVAVEKNYDESAYKTIADEIKKAFNETGEQFVVTIRDLLHRELPKEVRIHLVRYGVWGSYHLPDKITYNINTKDGTKTLFHEMIHLAVESLIQKHDIKQWEKERIIDLILHSEQFAFLDYTPWQRDYHGVESYIDSLFSELFYKNQKKFFSEISVKRKV